MDGKRILCKGCAGDYSPAGVYAFPDGEHIIKKSSNLWGRPGFDHITGERRKESNNEKG